MKPTTIVIAGLVLGTLFALSAGSAIAQDIDAIEVAPDEAIIVPGTRRAVVTVNAPTFPARGTRVWVIAYGPDGQMLTRPRRRLLRKGKTKIALPLGAHPQVGTYRVYTTVESGSQAFGVPTKFTAVR